jgi:hypothetical protein
VDTLVLPCWQPGAASLDAVAQARAQLPSSLTVAAYVTAVDSTEMPDMRAYVADLGSAGATRLDLYHLGLAGPARWADLRAAVAGATDADT